jgi:indolepyruvate ferredoxin oxidoreductase beta subunit
MESLRYLPWLSARGWLVTNSTPFINIGDYPSIEEILNEIRKVRNNIIIDADSIAKEAGSSRAGNIVMLGAASPFIDLPYSEIEDAVRKQFYSKGEEIVNINLKALSLGRKFSHGKK